MATGFKYLVLADESPEFPAALLYGALRAKTTGAGLVMLHVIEPSSWTHWVSVGEEMREEALENARALTGRFAAEVWAEAGLEPEIVIREGELHAELKRLVEQDRDIKVVVLAAGVGREGPGPLISSLAKGNGLGGARPLPTVVVPGSLTKTEIRDLAAPSVIA
jgi:nucleotide-binding universal stress UspA family protein